MMFIMGIAFLLKGSSSLEVLGITWAIIGIRKASKSLNAAIRQFFCRNNNCVIPMIEFFVRITLALLLLFNPIEKISNHVIILGLEIIIKERSEGGLNKRAYFVPPYSAHFRFFRIEQSRVRYGDSILPVYIC